MRAPSTYPTASMGVRWGPTLFGWKMNLLAKPIRVAKIIKAQPSQAMLTCRLQRWLYYSEST